MKELKFDDKNIRLRWGRVTKTRLGRNIRMNAYALLGVFGG